MTYDEARNSIASGDVLVWSVKGIKSVGDIVRHLIRIGTESEYEHIGIAYVVGGRVFVVEAVEPLVRIYPLSKELPFYHIPMGIQWTNELEEFLLSKVGDKYSIIDAIKGWLGKPDFHNHLWQCTELTHALLDKAGFHLGDAYNPSSVVEAILSLDIPGFKPCLHYVTSA